MTRGQSKSKRVYWPIGTALVIAGGISHCLAAELEVRITTERDGYHSVQQLDSHFEHFESGALLNEAENNIRTYEAIRCDGPWGAMKYQVSLASGPGFSLRKAGDTLLLQIVEHTVISEDRNIQAMKMHCLDVAPKSIVHAIALIEIEGDRENSAQQTLPNGYKVEFHYQP